MVVESVAVQPGSAVRAGDRLLDLRIGRLRASLCSEWSGTVRDVRAVAGDGLIADRVVLWMESDDPPPLEPGAGAYRESAGRPADPHEIRFNLPAELLRSRTARVNRVLVSAGDHVEVGKALLEVAVSPLRFEWPAAADGAVTEVMVKPGDELAEGTAVARLAGGERTAPPASEPAPAARLEIPELTLAEFRRTANALRQPVEELAALAASLGLANGAELLRAEMAKVAGCRFSFAVVGEFKRGKSTFLNALAGGEFLPHDVLPCTAFACRFQYGDRPQLILVQPDGAEVVSPLGTLAEIAAELNRLTRDPQTSLREAIVRLPLDLCRDGADLIDTPGLNDSEAMNQVTLAVLPNVDAAALLLIPESPLSDTERSFLEDHLLAKDMGRIVFVLTAKDRVPPAKLDRLVTYLQGQIDRILQARGRTDLAGAPLVCISSQEELQAPGSPSSGFAGLRAQLNHLMFRERGRLLLIHMVQRIRRAASDAKAAVELHLAQIASSRESFQASLRDTERQLDTTRLHAGELRRRLVEAQVQAESLAGAHARQLYLALLGARESLPQEVSADLLKRGAEEIRTELGSLLQQNAGKLYQQTLTALLTDLHAVYQPVARAVRLFFDQAGHRGMAPLEAPPDKLEFHGGFLIRIDLSLGALSWLYLAESASSILSGGDLAQSIQARALAKLRENYGDEIEQQVRLKSSEAMLKARLAEFVRRPFNDLMQRLDLELKALLDDSMATLAALRESAAPAADSQPRDWEETYKRIESAAERCEAPVFAIESEIGASAG
jgi:biotin carboxyl carrier protein